LLFYKNLILLIIQMHIPEKEFLRMWKLKPVVTVDCAVLKDNKILLIKRNTTPFKGFWCLPGGLMETGETIEQTAVRELKEETGITAKILGMLGIYSGPARDPRGTSLTVVFVMEPVKSGGKTDNEVSEMTFFSHNKLPAKMGFDHMKIVKDVFKALNHKCSSC